MSPMARDYLALKWRWMLAEDDADAALADAEMARLEPHMSDEDAVMVLLAQSKVVQPCGWPLNEH